MKSAFTFFKWGFFLLVALNITLIILFLLPKDDRHHHGPPRFDRIIAHLDETLQLSEKQHADLVQLFERHKSEMDSIHRQSDHMHNQMIECLKSGDVKCDALQQQPSFTRILFAHHQRILQILTPAQRQKYLVDLDTHRPPGPPPF